MTPRALHCVVDSKSVSLELDSDVAPCKVPWQSSSSHIPISASRASLDCARLRARSGDPTTPKGKENEKRKKEIRKDNLGLDLTGTRLGAGEGGESAGGDLLVPRRSNLSWVERERES